MKALLNVGVRDEFPEWLQIKIRLCNVMTYLIASMALSFLIVTYMYFRPMAVIPAIAIFFCIITPLLNQMGFIKLSRIVISIVIIFLAVLFTASMTEKGNDPDFGFWGMALSVLIIPFILFDYKEIVLCTSCFVFGAIFLMLFQLLNTLLEFELPYPGVVHILSNLSSITAITIIFFSLFWLSKENRESEKRNFDLLSGIEKSRQEVENTNKKLQTSMDELKKFQEEERSRQWIADGLTGMIQLMKSDSNSNKTFDALLTYIVNYVNANQGVLFINDFDHKILSLTSCYAYSRKKYITSQVEYGQGLIGQCYLEKQAIYLTQVPADYIKITSGLGEGLPRSVYISPLINQDKVEGILELAFFKTLTSDQTEFITKASEYMAIILSDHRRRSAINSDLLSNHLVNN